MPALSQEISLIVITNIKIAAWVHDIGYRIITDEGKIIQVADKLFLINPEIISLLTKYSEKKAKESDLIFIRKQIDKALKLLQEFELK